MTKDIANRIGFSTEPTPGVNGKADGVWDLYDLAYFKEKNIWPTDSSSYIAPTGSLRFFGSNNPVGSDVQNGYLLKVFDNYGDSTKWTFSTWINSNPQGTNNNRYLFGVGLGRSNTDRESIYLDDNNGRLFYSAEGFRGVGNPDIDNFTIRSDSNSLLINDWNHVVVSFDSTVAISTNRIKYWINGIRVPTEVGGATTISQNYRSKINTKNLHIIGGQLNLSPLYISAKSETYVTDELDASLADIHFIDGQSLEASNFGQFNSFGIWTPKLYDSSDRNNPYGSNGFKLNFSDTSSTSINRIGKDFSGNDNHWYPYHRISIGTTSLITNDGLTGSTTVGQGAFDVLDNNNYNRATSNGGIVIWNPDKAITAYESIKVWAYDVDSANFGTIGIGFSIAKLNEADLIPPGNYPWDQVYETFVSDFTPYIFPGPYPVGITSLKLQANNNRQVRLYGVEVDGVMVTTNNKWQNRTDGVYFKSNQNANSPFESSSDSVDNGFGGEIFTNYCRLSPWYNQSSNLVYDGNLRYEASGGVNNFIVGSIAVSSGKWYWEAEWINAAGGAPVYAGITSVSTTGRTSFINVSPFTQAPLTSVTGFIGLTTTSDNGEVLGFTLDFDNLQLRTYKNNVLYKTDTIAPGVEYAAYFGETYTPGQDRTQFLVNFGSVPFNYQAPSGFKCLCSDNLPTPRVGIGNTLFNVITYSGTGSQQSFSSLNFKPDLVWIKSLTSTTPHAIYDSVRGPQRRVGSSTDFSEIRDTDGLISFDSNGFTVGVGTTTNFNGGRFTALCWNVGGGSTVVNTSGVITSYVKSNPTCGVGIITYVGTGVTSTVGHGLTTAPSLVFIKNRTDNLTNWAVYYPSNNNDSYLRLNTDQAGSNNSGNTFWGSTAPTSSVFTVGISSLVNQVNKSYLAYAFADSPDFMKVGAYRSSSSNGAFVWTGFKPRIVLTKNEDDTVTNWNIHFSDYIRQSDSSNNIEFKNGRIRLNTNVVDTSNNLEITNSGFRVSGNDGTDYCSINRVIYIAISELAYKYMK